MRASYVRVARCSHGRGTRRHCSRGNWIPLNAARVRRTQIVHTLLVRLASRRLRPGRPPCPNPLSSSCTAPSRMPPATDQSSRSCLRTGSASWRPPSPTGPSTVTLQLSPRSSPRSRVPSCWSVTRTGAQWRPSPESLPMWRPSSTSPVSSRTRRDTGGAPGAVRSVGPRNRAGPHADRRRRRPHGRHRQVRLGVRRRRRLRDGRRPGRDTASVVRGSVRRTGRGGGLEDQAGLGVVATQDHTINPDVQRYGYRRAGVSAIEVDSSHLVMIAQPTVVADLIRKAVTSVAD